jgi:hypothetical protein
MSHVLLDENVAWRVDPEFLRNLSRVNCQTKFSGQRGEMHAKRLWQSS